MNKQIEQHFIENRVMYLKVLVHRAGTPEGAEDVIQDAYERALRYKGSYRSSGKPFTTWFNAILNNALRDYKAKERRLGMSVEYDESLDEGVSLQDCEEETVEQIRLEVSRKKFPVRQALHLYFFKQYKPREIAQVLEMTNGYIRTSVKEFKQQMRAKYGSVV